MNTVLSLVFGLAVALIAQISKASMMEECKGCHTNARTISERKIEKFEINIWNDQKCFGCHAELVDIANNVENKGAKDKRLLALPLRHETITKIAKNGMPYLQSKENLDISKYNADLLIAYLKQPAVVSDKWSMPAFPNITMADVGIDKAHSSTNSENGSSLKGAEIYVRKCSQCHDQNLVPKIKLSTYKSDWIHTWTNGLNPDEFQTGRTMPIIPISSQDARDLSEFFRAEASSIRSDMNAGLDRELATRYSERGAKFPVEIASKYVWLRLFKDGRCIHCHTGEQRAAQFLEATPEGLRKFLKSNSGKRIWEALERRDIEHSAKVGAQSPGMPMGGPALPKEIRDMVKIWVKEECPDDQQKKLCEKKNVVQ